jgi:hypothetical protein
VSRRVLLVLLGLAAVYLTTKNHVQRAERRAHSDALRLQLRVLSHRLAAGEAVEAEIAQTSAMLAAARTANKLAA